MSDYRIHLGDGDQKNLLVSVICWRCGSPVKVQGEVTMEAPGWDIWSGVLFNTVAEAHGCERPIPRPGWWKRRWDAFGRWADMRM